MAVNSLLAQITLLKKPANWTHLKTSFLDFEASITPVPGQESRTNVYKPRFTWALFRPTFLSVKSSRVLVLSDLVKAD